MKLYLDLYGIKRNTRILHFAPESGLYKCLRSLTDEYVVADYDLDRYSHIPDIQFVDLMDPASYERFGSFDIILHSHVIEHIPYNYSALLLRLHRMLTPRGVHAFSFPIYGTFYHESWGPMTGEEATRLFGQFDHIRRFSAKDIDRTIGAIFDLPKADLLSVFDEDTLTEANIPREFWSGWNGTSVFWLRKEAALLR